MKQISLCVVSLCLFGILLACGRDNKQDLSTSIKNARYEYPVENAVAFTEDNGKVWITTKDSSVVTCYDENGNKLSEIDLGDGEHTSLNICGDDLVAFTYTDHGPQITQYNMGTGEITVNRLSEDITGALSMAVTKDEIYLIYWKEDYEEHDGDIEAAEVDGYVDMGEKAVVLDRESYKETDLSINHPIALYQVSNDQIMYYAHDEKGYYFSVYDCTKHEFGENVYNDTLQYIFGFAADIDKNIIISSDFSNKRLVATDIEKSGSKEEFADQIVVMTGNDIQYNDGKCYALDDITKHIIRVDYLKSDRGKSSNGNKDLVFYRTMSMEEPYGCGYSIHTEMLEEDEFALSVMAGDSTYDVCMVDTSETKAWEIREKGAFYPLNEVPYVKEYLELCHDYIKDTATNENGEIWMIPIAVDIPFILYNDDTCKENGISMEETLSYRELLEAADHLYENEQLRDWYSLNGYQLQQDMIDQYNEELIRRVSDVDYDTQEFRNICELMKEHSADDDASLHTWVMQSSSYGDDSMENYYNQYIFELLHYYDIGIYDELPYTMLRACMLPGVTDTQNIHYGTCICLCVNDNSDNLESTLQYISAYCQYMMGREDTYLFKDYRNVPYPETQLSKDIYAIYEDGGIGFEFPEEIFWDTYFLYQNNEITFSEMAEELKRKVSMYLYE